MSDVLTISPVLGATMSQNDVLALESNFNNWCTGRAVGLKNVDPFVYYCVEQFVKPFDLSDEEITYGITDGGNDGGVDAIYFLVNKRLVREDTDLDPKASSKVNLVIFQMKNSASGFSPIEINKLFFFTEDLLDLSRQASSFTAKYHAHLIEIMRIFKEKYLTILGTFPSVTIDYYYITKGDELKPDKNARDAADMIKVKAAQLLSAQCEYHCINVQALLEQVKRRPPREKMLAWAESPMSTKEGYVGLVKLRDFYEFIKDENGDLAERIFEANVRGFQQDTPVNKEIRKTLGSISTANFWLLNNGITIIAEKAQPAHLRLSLEDPQIVNGLQTSREIFTYFSVGKPLKDERSILVKVIETPDSIVQDAVVRATNSQNKMPSASLRATDPIHHRIEDLFKQYDLYYDRRKGFYKDKGKPIAKIISVTELLQAVVTIVLQRPDDARGRPSDYLKDDDKYESVFGDDRYPLPIYLTCLRLMERVEKFIYSLEGLERNDKRNMTFYVAAILACKLTQEADPSPEKLLQIDISAIDGTILNDCYMRAWKIYEALGGNDKVARGTDLLKRLRTHIKRSLAANRP